MYHSTLLHGNTHRCGCSGFRTSKSLKRSKAVTNLLAFNKYLPVNPRQNKAFRKFLSLSPTSGLLIFCISTRRFVKDLDLIGRQGMFPDALVTGSCSFQQPCQDLRCSRYRPSPCFNNPDRMQLWEQILSFHDCGSSLALPRALRRSSGHPGYSSFRLDVAVGANWLSWNTGTLTVSTLDVAIGASWLSWNTLTLIVSTTWTTSTTSTTSTATNKWLSLQGFSRA